MTAPVETPVTGAGVVQAAQSSPGLGDRAGPAKLAQPESGAGEPVVTRLANGFRVVTCEMPHVETVSLGVWVGTGARFEAEREHGISHLLEHMAFKGTKRRSARAIAEEIEEIGGDLNAATSLETTAYYARVLAGDEALALDVLSDILLNPTYDLQELSREKDVILQEIAGSQDSPDDLVYDLAQDAAFTGQPLGRTILGTPESVSAFGAGDLRDYAAGHYCADRMVLSAAGKVDHDRLVQLAEDLFGAVPGGEKGLVEPAVYRGGLRSTDRPFEQSHLIYAFSAPSYRDPDYFAAQVLSGILGGGMSSRLFQEVREERGLCYAIYTSGWGVRDAGLFVVHAATSSDLVEELSAVSSQCLAEMAQDGPTEKEVLRARAQLKAGLMMSLESSAARAEQMARHLLAHDRLISPEELVAKVELVDGEAIRACAERMISQPACAVVVGSGAASRDQAAAAANKLVQNVRAQ